MANTYDFIGNKLIIQLGGTGSVNMDTLYSRWKDWVASGTGSEFPPAFRFVGGDPTVGQNALGVTYFIRNGWKIRPASTNHILQINGNLFRDGGGNPFTPALGNVNVTIQQQVSNLVDQTVAENPIQDKLDYNGVVYVNPENGEAGSDHPVGTSIRPVNNFNDAILIAEKYGLIEFLVHDEIFITENLTNKKISAINVSDACVTLSSSAELKGVEFRNIEVTGEIGINSSEISFTECNIFNLNNISGFINESTLEGTIGVAKNQETILFRNTSSRLDNDHDTIIDMSNADDTHVTFRGFRGKLNVYNLTEPLSRLDIDMDVGMIVLDSSNTDGKIMIHGAGNLIDESNGAEIIKDGLFIARFINDFLSKEGILGDVTISKNGLLSSYGTEIQYVDNGDGSITIKRIN